LSLAIVTRLFIIDNVAAAKLDAMDVIVFPTRRSVCLTSSISAHQMLLLLLLMITMLQLLL